MTGSDSEGAGPVYQAELATFRQDMANEVAQIQAALQRTVDTTSTPHANSLPGGQGKAPAGSGRNPSDPWRGHRCWATAPPAPPCSAS